MADSSPAAWEDLAADIRRVRASDIEKVAARVAELEAAIARAIGYLRDDKPVAARKILEAAHA